MNRDHNSLTAAMGLIAEAFFRDANSITGIDFDRDRRRVGSLLANSGRVGLLHHLQEHHVCLLGWFQHGRLNEGACKRDRDGVPVFLHELWRRLDDEAMQIQAVTLLRQATSLFRKWREDTVPEGASTDAFVTRMTENKKVVPYELKWITSFLPRFLSKDLEVGELGIGRVTTGARAEKTPILRRVDELVRCTQTREDELMRGQEQVLTSAYINRLVEVPKDWSKNRLVFAEPSPSMNLQQALRSWLEENVCASAEGSRRISFDDQSFQHRRLRAGDAATIDLSDASDHLTTRVIWSFLREFPRLRSALFGARSRRTRLGDMSEGLALTCFGTMGNATTFPVMTLFLATLCCAAEEEVFRYSGRRARRSTVFGDDIICDDFVAGTVLRYLCVCGLKPNTKKTYVGTAFRESCGVDLFRGEDVTPIYVKKVASHTLEDKESLVALSNAFYRATYWHLARLTAEMADIPLSVNFGSHGLVSYASGWMVGNPQWDPNEQRYTDILERAVRAEGRRARVRRRDSHLDLHYALEHGGRIQDRCSRA